MFPMVFPFMDIIMHLHFSFFLVLSTKTKTHNYCAQCCGYEKLVHCNIVSLPIHRCSMVTPVTM